MLVRLRVTSSNVKCISENTFVPGLNKTTLVPLSGEIAKKWSSSRVGWLLQQYLKLT